MDWIETYTGKKFYPLNAATESISVVDIAHSLSYLSRFNGHGQSFYSIAQHSINTMNEIKRLGGDERTQIVALYHDASEAYLSDLVTPVKRNIKDYKIYESNLMSVIWQYIGFFPTLNEFEMVDKVDKAILSLEAKELMKCTHWQVMDSYMLDNINIHIELNERPFIYFKNMFLQESCNLLLKKEHENSLIYKELISM